MEAAVTEWRDMETAPKDGNQFLVKLSSGRIAIAEWWEGPPGKEESWGGWGICMTQSFGEGTLKDDCDANMVGWSRPDDAALSSSTKGK